MDVEVRYDHGDDITCVCTSAWDEELIFTVPGPLIRY